MLFEPAKDNWDAAGVICVSDRCDDGDRTERAEVIVVVGVSKIESRKK
jgi:hypothetical protein